MACLCVIWLVMSRITTLRVVQADCVLVVANGEASPEPTDVERQLLWQRREGARNELILLHNVSRFHPSVRVPPSGGEGAQCVPDLALSKWPLRGAQRIVPHAGQMSTRTP